MHTSENTNDALARRCTPTSIWLCVCLRVILLCGTCTIHILNVRACMFIWSSQRLPAVYFQTQEWGSHNCPTLKALAFSESNNMWLWREYFHVFKGKPGRVGVVVGRRRGGWRRQEGNREKNRLISLTYACVWAAATLDRHPLRCERGTLQVGVETFWLIIPTSH